MHKYNIPGQITLSEWLADIGQSIPEKIKYKGTPRHPWEYYGISKERSKELSTMAQQKEYAPLVSSAAHRANEMLSGYILLSVTKNLSYEGLQTLWELREIERMPCGRSDFYGWRREFYGIFNQKLKEMGK
ncbi:MAG: hypothetical protein NC548_31320 [Lachnospiraceae bacterium]|nr:hypothetical protein [Bacteroides fragilis]MCM1218995.1 hypothetical protein [Lachnospiraceae bacterium]